MGILDHVVDLKKRGMSENEIENNLREQGVSPKEINDALSQSQIKNAISSQDAESQFPQRGMEPSIMRAEKAESLPTEGSAPSDSDLTPPPSYSKIPRAAQRNFGPMTKELENSNSSENEQDYIPSPEEENYDYQPEDSYQQNSYSQQYPSENYGGYSEGYQQEYYPQEEYGSSSAGVTDTDTMIEISEQVFSEKIKSINKQIESFSEFKTLAESKIENISERLKRIESNIDQLQSAILEKVGSYGRGLDLVKKEMSMMQDSFSKMVGSSAKHTQTKHSSPTVHRSKKEITVVHKSHKPRKTKTSKKKSSRKK